MSAEVGQRASRWSSFLLSTSSRLRRVLATAADHPLLVVVLVALAARLSVAVVSFVFDDHALIPDEAQYIGLASSVARGDGAEAWYPGYGASLFRSTWVFTAPLALLLRVFGESRLVGQLWAVTWGVAAAAGTAKLALGFVARRWAIAAGLVVAALPSQVLFSSTVLREAMVWSALVALALALAGTARGGSLRSVPAAAAVFVLLLGLGFLRSQAAVAASIAVVLAAWLMPSGRLIRGLLLTTAAVVAPALAGLGPLGLDLATSASENLARTRATLSFSASTGFADADVLRDDEGETVPCEDRHPVLDPSTPTTAPGAVALAGDESTTVLRADGTRVEVICGPEDVYVLVDDSVGANVRDLPRSIAANLFRPFVWDPSRGWLDRLAAYENLIWYALYALAVIGVVVAARRRLHAALLPFFATATVLGASIVSQGNVGTAFRHRGEILWALAIFAALGADHLFRDQPTRS